MCRNYGFDGKSHMCIYMIHNIRIPSRLPTEYINIGEYENVVSGYRCTCTSLFIMYILGLEFGVFGGLINPVCSLIRVCLLIRLSCFEMLCLDLNNIVRFVPASCAIYLSSSVGRALGLESRVVGSSPTWGS